MAIEDNVPENSAWRILVVGGDDSFHELVSTSLAQFAFAGTPVFLLSANSSKKARVLLENENNIALILIASLREDVCSEFNLIRYIRDELRNMSVQIVTWAADLSLGTEGDVMEEYAINYCQKKVEVFPDELLSIIRWSLSSYQNIRLLEETIATKEESIRKRKEEKQKCDSKIKKQNSQLVLLEKMASIGSLTAGIAHEMNNPIGFVRSNLATLQEYLPRLLQVLTLFHDAGERSPELLDRDELKSAFELWEKGDVEFVKKDIVQLLEESTEGMERINAIIVSLKNFSHSDDFIWEKADLNTCLEDALRLAWNELKYTCEVTKKLSPLPKISCSARHVSQVFINILINASHAIKDHGTITISSESTENEVIVRISDTGSGIPKGIRGKIFNPFYSTKEVGEGTGLGLSISLSIIKRHNGKITVDSVVGKGTTFSIIVPIS